MFIAPLKYPKKIPEILYYHKTQGTYRQNNLYNMLSTKTGKKHGFLVTWVKNSNLKDYYEGNCLFIGFIITSPTRNGFGEKLLNFAKQLSKKDKCNGHIQLWADGSFMPQNVPHLFYRKNGFSTLDEKIDKKMDKFIKSGKDATHKDFPNMPMFYPAPDKYPTPKTHKKPSIFSKVKDFFKKIF